MASQSVTTLPGTRVSYEWTARIRCLVSELGTNFSVNLFLGPIPEPPADPTTSPNYVASFATYHDDGSYPIGEKRFQGGSSRGAKLVEGFVHLSQVILKRGGFQTLELENVVSYLKSNLKWCVLNSMGERADLHDLPSLEVMVLEVPQTWGPGERIPKIGPPIEHPDITHGKEGGAK
ncbi:hypothetical protein FRC04_001932 [Tulasnella sp. 424]|nr:hypothetical protein FRC04_001932 [Tulasnella sp. 424]KAG8977709.1 hypothetical protein FRC05_000965 [Tulasnella sp. 425]